MELIISTIMGELAGRSISFLVDRYMNRTAAPADNDKRTSRSLLQRLLLRVHIIVEEAEQRRITSHAMLRQLNVLREEMFRGYHALDHESRRRITAGDGGAVSRRYSAVSRFSPTKRVRLLGRQTVNDQLQHALGSLESIVADVGGEFVTLLAGCPRLNLQPYSTYMFLDNCMFGRHMELERVMAFLLQRQEAGQGPRREPDVLTILGPRKAGKSTLVEHAYRDERVRNHFSQIIFLTRGDLGVKDEDMLLKALTKGDQETTLVIVELDGDRNCKGQDAMAVTENWLERFCSTCKSRVPCVTKIIVTSRSDKISSFGTVEPLRLRPLAEEAFWYFVKARVFGSTDEAEHPKMVSIAMDTAAEMGGSFAAVNMFGGLMRSNFDARFWSLALEVLREFRKRNLFSFRHGSHHQCEIAEQFVYLDDYQIKPSSTNAEIPKVSLKDILFGGARPQGKFDVVAWKSPVPPYYSYAYLCEILMSPQRGN